jgi:uncharacterized protein YlaI
VGCGKTSYLRKSEAMAARKRALRRRKNRPDYLRAYYCDDCQAWHLTKQRHHHD